MSETQRARGRARRGPSMADVALHAGVSGQTVSRVSNGLPNVDSTTRERVLASMKELGYRPNGAARALKSGRFHSIGVITFTLATHGNMRTLDAIVTAAGAADYSVSLIPVPDPTSGAVSGAYRRLSDEAVDGVVLIFEARLIDRVGVALPPGIPIVVVDSDTASASGHAVVDNDQALGARQATEHLLGLGHRQVHHIAGPESSFSAGHRADSWRATLREAGITPPEVIHGDWSAESGYRAGLELGRRDDVTAVFAANDHMALGAMRAFHELGLDVPRDISVVGFDALQESASFWPALTSVRQDFATVGRLIVERLLAQIEDPDDVDPTPTIVATELVVRESTAPPRA